MHVNVRHTLKLLKQCKNCNKRLKDPFLWQIFITLSGQLSDTTLTRSLTFDLRPKLYPKRKTS